MEFFFVNSGRSGERSARFLNLNEVEHLSLESYFLRFGNFGGCYIKKPRKISLWLLAYLREVLESRSRSRNESRR